MQTAQVIKAAGDAAAHTTVIATLLGWLPAIAALFSILWLTIQMSEKITGEPFHKIVARFFDWVRNVVRRMRG